MATVVHLRRKDGVEVVGCDVYIGRAMYQGGWRLAASPWANPHRLPPGGGTAEDREAVLAAYEQHVRSSPTLLAALPTLRGLRLGCWCKPLPCHGDVLVALLHELDAQAAPNAPDTSGMALHDDDPFWACVGL